jgi:hypothetical protein
MNDDEIALEKGRVPNGILLAPEASALHETAAQHLESLLRKISSSPPHP